MANAGVVAGMREAEPRASPRLGGFYLIVTALSGPSTCRSHLRQHKSSARCARSPSHIRVGTLPPKCSGRVQTEKKCVTRRGC
jgi:hypothetical protein